MHDLGQPQPFEEPGMSMPAKIASISGQSFRTAVASSAVAVSKLFHKVHAD